MDLSAALKESLDKRAVEALSRWKAPPQVPTLLTYRENAVYRVDLGDRPAALRIHRAGYHSRAALESELAWKAYLASRGLNVPLPQETRDGRIVVTIPGDCAFPEQHVDVLSWMEGERLGGSGLPFGHPREMLLGIFKTVGAQLAKLHNFSDEWTPPGGFERPSWDAEGLIGESPFWGRFWDCPALTDKQAGQLSAIRATVKLKLAAIQNDNLDFGLIHADLVRENILFAGDEVAFIDFDDSGFGWRLFDLAVALFHWRAEPDFEEIKLALIDGYRSRRPLSDSDLKNLPLFSTLRGLSYVGWIAHRREIPGSEQRLQHYIAESLALAEQLSG